MERYGDTFSWLADEVERASDPDAKFEPGGAWVIDLKRRAYVALQPDERGSSVMRRVLRTFVSPEHWAVCNGCAARQICPIHRNAVALGANEDEESSLRLEQLLLLSHLRGRRHITMRDLRSGLAYLITSDTSCESIHAARHANEPLPASPYWQSAFTTENSTDISLGELAPLDPARFAQPRLERFFYFHQTPSDAPRRASIFRDDRDLPPADDPVEWLDLLKRRLYFESHYSNGFAGDAVQIDWPALLPYRFAEDFVAALAGTLPLGELLPRVARGIGRSEGLSGPVLAHSDANHLTVLKQFPLDTFDIEVARPPASEIVEALPQALLLIHKPTNARTELTLDLFELLMRLADGLDPASPELQPLLEDLAPFKSAVQLSNTQDLILVEANNRLHRLTQRNGKVVRMPMEHGVEAR
jgi:hypothetical protein